LPCRLRRLGCPNRTWLGPLNIWRCPMPVDLDKIRALLASVGLVHPWRLSADKTPGPMEIVYFDGSDEDGDGHAALSVHPDYAELFAAAPDLHSHLTEAVAEIERLRAHNARMVAQIGALADACEAAMSSEDGPLVVCDALPGRRWSECSTALRRLAAGEVDDG